MIGGSSARDQTVQAFDIITAALSALGGSLRDVTRTRILLRNVEDCMEVVTVHGRLFEREGVRPANMTIGGAVLVGDELKVEVEVDAVVDSGDGEVYRI